MHDSQSAIAEPRRILVVRNRFVGDTMLAIPFLRNLRRRFPDAVIDVLCESGTTALLVDCPYVDGLLEWKRPPRIGRVIRGSLGNVMEFAGWLKARRYDRAYLLKRSLSSALLAWLADIPCRVGFSSIGDWLLTKPVAVVPHRHQADLFLDLLRCEGIRVDDGHNENWTTKAAVAKADRLLARFPRSRLRVFVAPQSTDEHKRWPLERMGAIIDWLVNQRGCEVFLCGGPEDFSVHATLMRSISRETAAHVHDHSIDVSLRDLGGFLSRMDLCVGVDTGLNHVAAAHGVPVVVLVGPSDANRWYPWRVKSEVVKGTPADHGSRRRAIRGDLPWDPAPALMTTITVERVMEAVNRLLPRRPAMPQPSRPALRVVDLRQGSFRYAVASSRPAAAAEPATKPLAHAH